MRREEGVEQSSTSSSLEEFGQPDQPSDVSSVQMQLDIPRRSLQIQFTCNSCGTRTTRMLNPTALTRGTVFVQCQGCKVYHQLVDNLGLIEEYDLRENVQEQTGTDG
eukprot:SM000030S11501  [mRNA]  locus=s30:900504:901461:- [translate_table: standard]